MLLDLVRAEITKTRHAPFVRGLLFLSAALPLVLMLIVGAAWSTETDAMLRWPASAATVGEFFFIIAVLVPSTLVAWLVGVEQTGDTWKLILVRRPTRVGFLIAKLVVVAGVFVPFAIVTLSVWLAAHEAAGLLIGQQPTGGAVVVEGALVDVASGFLIAALVGSLALLGAVLVPRNGTVAGSVGALISVSVVNMIDQADAPVVTFVRPVQWAAARLVDAELHPTLVGLDPIRCCVVLAVWWLAPVLIAFVVFARRDIESGAAG